MRTLSRLRVFAVGLVVIVLGSTVVPAAADTGKVVRTDDSWSFEDVAICGLTVDIVGQSSFRGTIHEWVIGPNDPPADNFWIGNFNDHGSQTFTNVATGASVTGTWSRNVKEASMVDIGGGFWEYTYAINGPVVRLGGRPIDVGRIAITDTIYLGDLSTEADDYFVCSTALSDAGRHPAFYSEKPFCDALVAAIG